MSPNPPPPRRLRLRTLVVWGVLPLLAGILLAMWLVPQPMVGIIYLDDVIYAGTARDWAAQIAYARDDPSVRAVVLVVDSPGGTVADTEALYLELARLRERKPVVSVIESMAASGGYYLVAGTDFVFAKPTSDVGNVGVISWMPDEPAIIENLATTGPYKAWGAPRDQYLRQMEMVKQGFYEAVRLGRGDALRIPREELLRGELWPGSEALRRGLVDALGTQSDAVAHAAQLAHIAHYRTANVRDLTGLPLLEAVSFFIQAPDGSLTLAPQQAGLYLLYVPPTDRRLP